MRTLLAAAMTQFLVAAPAAAEAVASHVLVIGVDGMGPLGIENADTPNFDRLIAAGAHTFEGRAVMPTSSSPNWASMIMGAGPEQHGVLDNEWPLPKGFLPPTAKGDGGIFPTMFHVVRRARPDAFTAVIYDWGGFGRLYENKLVNVNIDGDGEEDTAAQAARVIREHKPVVTFVQLDHVDHALHAHGFGSEAYFEAVEEADRLAGVMLDALDEAGIAGETVVIVTADHGGDGKNHGGTTLTEMTIPWVIAGPGVQAGKTIAAPVDIFDTAATVVHVLGLEPHKAWIARPVLEAFQP